jgi:hypothetical protein
MWKRKFRKENLQANTVENKETRSSYCPLYLCIYQTFSVHFCTVLWFSKTLLKSPARSSSPKYPRSNHSTFSHSQAGVTVPWKVQICAIYICVCKFLTLQKVRFVLYPQEVRFSLTLLPNWRKLYPLPFWHYARNTIFSLNRVDVLAYTVGIIAPFFSHLWHLSNSLTILHCAYRKF